VERLDPADHEIQLKFHVIPNMTLVLETTEISVGAY
jgi:hypothetical protein